MFRTELNPKTSNEKIEIGSSIISIGSCFANVIGQQLADNKFDVCKNPFGTIYNPLSIIQLLSLSLRGELPDESKFIEIDEIHMHHDFHSDFSAPNKEKLAEKIKTEISQTSLRLQKCDWIIITLGTAFIYELKKGRSSVANCHKVPASNFDKRILSAEEIESSFLAFFQEFKNINPHTKYIITVSPVRHTKDTLEMNSLSKAILRTASHAISEKLTEISYFPSFEIMMDDLRDYRFYADDMIHPGSIAEKYIWEKFRSSYFSLDTNEFINSWSSLRSAINHRPFHPGSVAHQKFVRKTISKLEQLPYSIDVSEELSLLKKQVL